MKITAMINQLQGYLELHGDLDVTISVDGVPGFPGSQLNVDTYNVGVEVDNGVLMITGDNESDD